MGFKLTSSDVVQCRHPAGRRTRMSLTLEQLKDIATDLPASQQVELAQFLLRSLDEKVEADVRAEWLALAERRMAQIKAGNVVGIPAEDVLKSLPGSSA